jgi:glutamine amidotransferase
MAAYVGPEIALEDFLLKPAHSLVVQSYMPQELKYARVNADGFGVGWYTEDDMPATYRNPMPIWSDANLPHLGRSLINNVWLANVRSATAGNPVDHANTQPFHDDELLFMHNGFIDDFSLTVRPQLLGLLSPEISADIRGVTDSEYLFAMLRQMLSEDQDIAIDQALADMFSRLGEWLGEHQALLNLVISDGELVYACRHAFNHDCPSLYYTTDDEDFEDAQLIASERLTGSDFWQPVPEHHILVLDPECPPELLAL